MSKPMSKQIQKVADRYEKATGKRFDAKTNAQHIRSMTDEELAKFLNDFFWGAKKEVRLFHLRKWLEQPYKGGKENGTN